MNVIRVDNLTKVFDKKKVVSNLNFELESGKCIGLLGPNGAGKTTTLRMLAGLLKPTAGMIAFENLPAGTDFRERIGYLPQYPVFYNWMTGKEFLQYAAQLVNIPKQEAAERALKYLDKVGLEDAVHRRIGKYSGGMKQRLGIAQALIHRPKLLILDEPVSSLDPIGRREILDLMKQLKTETTILFSTHILNDAEEVSDKLLLMAEGAILEAGSLDDLRQKYQTAQLELSFRENTEHFFGKIKAEPGVKEIYQEGRNIKLIAEDTEKMRKIILRLAVTEDWPLIKFEVSRTTLEDLFMRVVKS